MNKLKVKPINLIINQYLKVFLSFGFLLCSGSAISASSAEAWLQKMSAAISSFNYQITFVVLTQKKEAQPYAWRHSVVDGVEMEHINLLNGAGSEVLRVGNRVSYFDTNLSPYSLSSENINGPIPFELLRHPLRLQNAYDFVLAGRSRISGRPAQQVRIVSKDNTRYSYNMWLDQQTGLILKLNMLDLSGKVLEQIQVTLLNVLSEPDDYFLNIEQDKLPQYANVNVDENIEHKWTVHWLPEGMEVTTANIHRLPLTGQLTDYIMLSDGLVNVSVYLQRITDEPPSNIALLSDTNTLVSKQVGPMAVTIIGKIPLNTANTIVNSIGAVGEQGQ
jgi:sigma-E factor negative regulatory protein RseB